MVNNHNAELWKHFTHNERLAQEISTRSFMQHTEHTYESIQKGQTQHTHGEVQHGQKKLAQKASILRLHQQMLPSTHDIGELRLLQHVPPLIRNGVKHALLPRSTMDLPEVGKPLRLMLRALGDTPSICSLECLAKNKWDLLGKIHISRFREQTITITFQQVADCLKCNG